MTNMCISAANYIVERTNSYNETRDFKDQVSLTCKRLQKLLYFSDVEYMCRNGGKSMFNDNYYAWPSGPVIPSVYTEFMRFQDGVMKPIIPTNNSELTQDMKNAIDETLDKTWIMDTSELVELSHIKNGPWSRFYNPDDEKHIQMIPKNSIYNYYKDIKIFT